MGDRAFTGPMNGYKNVEEYYASSSPHSKLHQIAVRTLILHARDDPVIGIDTLPMDEMRKNPKLLAAVTRRGGHLSWMSSAKHKGATWPDRVAAHFLEAQAGLHPSNAAMSRL